MTVHISMDSLGKSLSKTFLQSKLSEKLGFSVSPHRLADEGLCIFAGGLKDAFAGGVEFQVYKWDASTFNGYRLLFAEAADRTLAEELKTVRVGQVVKPVFSNDLAYREEGGFAATVKEMEIGRKMPVVEIPRNKSDYHQAKGIPPRFLPRNTRLIINTPRAARG